MYRCSSRSTAGVNNRYSSKEFVLASFMKGKKHAVIPMTAVNINPMNTDKAEIKICGDTAPLTIVAKGSRAQMNMDKTKFARETGSEEIDLGNFIDGEEEEKENREQDDFDISTSLLQTPPMPQRSTISKENSTNKPSESHSSSRSSINYTTNEKPEINFDTVFSSPSTSKKRQYYSDSSLDGSDDDDQEKTPRIVSKKRADTNDSNDMLNKLLSRKRAPAKKRKQITSTASDSTDTECKGCIDLREQIHKIMKRLERVERVIPAVKQFYRQKEIGLGTTMTSTATSLTNIEQINQSIKDIFGVEASEVKGPRERPTIIIRHLFTISNLVTEYRQYLEKHADLLKALVQYRCPGIINMDQTWHEIVKSMTSLANDMKKNLKTKLARQMLNAPNNQQQLITIISTNGTPTTSLDNVKMDVII